jgi:transporter family protein
MDIKTVSIAIFVAFLWSLSVLAQKHTLKFLPLYTVFAVSSLVYASFTLGVIAYNYKTIKDSLHTIDYRLLLILICGSLFGAFIPNILNLAILKNNKSFIIVALTYITPLFSTLLAYLFLQESVSVRELIGVLLIVCGVITIATKSREEFLPD